MLLWYYWLFAFWFVFLIEPRSWHDFFFFFYCSHNTESHIWTGLMGFSVSPLPRRWPGKAAEISGLYFPFLKQRLPAVTSGSRWKILCVGLCVFQLGHCSDITGRNGAVKVGRLTDAGLSCCYSYNSRLSAISVSAEAKHANVTVHIWVRLVKYCSERSVMCTGLTNLGVSHGSA